MHKFNCIPHACVFSVSFIYSHQIFNFLTSFLRGLFISICIVNETPYLQFVLSTTLYMYFYKIKIFQYEAPVYFEVHFNANLKVSKVLNKVVM